MPPPGQGCRRSYPALTAPLLGPASLAEGIPITEVSRWPGHRGIEVTVLGQGAKFYRNIKSVAYLGKVPTGARRPLIRVRRNVPGRQPR